MRASCSADQYNSMFLRVHDKIVRKRERERERERENRDDQ